MTAGPIATALLALADATRDGDVFGTVCGGKPAVTIRFATVQDRARFVVACTELAAMLGNRESAKCPA